jgi:site-specific recombinase
MFHGDDEIPISSKSTRLFLVAFGHSLNYAISFLMMQAGGFLLASKMPAATAATLVDAMEDPAKEHMASLRAISQTQTIFTMDNLLGAFSGKLGGEFLANPASFVLPSTRLSQS